MNGIRLNTEEEKTVVSAKFRVHPLMIVGLVLLTGLYVFLAVIFAKVWVLFGIVTIGYAIFAISLIVIMIGIALSSITVTNKRLMGVYYEKLFKTRYSYRLDEIDSVAITSTLGVHGLEINFTQGHGPQQQRAKKAVKGASTIVAPGMIRFKYVANAEEVYQKITDLIVGVKNDFDVMLDVETGKIAAENRKAKALEDMAGNKSADSSKSYIDELKGLKELRDAGVITDEEFDQKKKEILSRK